MGSQVFDKGSAPLPSVPSVTIQKRGLFSLNEAASALIGHPEAIQFLWDAEKRLIAVIPVKLEDPNAYPATLQAPSTPARVLEPFKRQYQGEAAHQAQGEYCASIGRHGASLGHGVGERFLWPVASI